LRQDNHIQTMARINKSDVIQKAVNDLSLSASEDKIPNETLDKVQLVYSLNRQFSNFIVESGSSATGTITLTLPTTSVGSEIYITSITIKMIKDATCDQATGRINLVARDDYGILKNILSIPIITLTAQSEDNIINFSYPLRIKINNTMTWAASYSVGLMSRTISVSGFTTSSN